jgi:glutamate 5-kinase
MELFGWTEALAQASAQRLSSARRIVVKVGSALLVDADTGQLNEAWLASLAADLARLRARGQQTIVVSSGAIALGSRRLGLSIRRNRLDESQAAAAVGQIQLARAWRNALDEHSIEVAQILLTLDDSDDRRRYINARTTMETLLRLGCMPVVNENDTVATAEIRYGDNDRLAARVAQMLSADCLVLLSDVEGLYSADPRSNPEARFIPEVERMTDDIAAMGTGAVTAFGSGGMTTKLAAARIATAAGCAMVIGLGRRAAPLEMLEQGNPCSWFLAEATPVTARKQWISGTLKPTGQLVVDAGAARALAAGSSLLPAGVLRVEGDFVRGAAVRLLSAEGVEIGRGLVAYPSDEAARLAGRQTREIADLLGYRGRDALVHRDDMVLTKDHLEPR